jgi:hypothetical protein
MHVRQHRIPVIDGIVRYLLLDPDLFRIRRRVQDGRNKNEQEPKILPVHRFLMSMLGKKRQ